MKRFKFVFKVVLLLTIATSCSKYDDGELWDKVNSLDGRVSSIENQLKSLNSNIASISSLADVLQNSLFITNITMSSNGYTLTFSDGSHITISDGKDGADGKDGVDAPVINIRYYENKYYWVQTVNGETTWLTDNDGNKIPASGADGVTPLLRVNADGYWIISYDNGKNYSLLKDENGNAIKASGKDGDSFFESVEVTEDGLKIVLRDGAVFIIPLGEQISYKDVDLGLSVRWASFNLGATAPTDFGGLYLWGYVGSNEDMPNYEAPNIDNISGTEYDIVRASWGSSWRIPSSDELEELAVDCVWERATVNGVDGMNVTGSNGKSIFIPNTGLIISEDMSIELPERQDIENGYYWSGDSFLLNSNRMGYSLYFSFVDDVDTNVYWSVNLFRLAIRPVKG